MIFQEDSLIRTADGRDSYGNFTLFRNNGFFFAFPVRIPEQYSIYIKTILMNSKKYERFYGLAGKASYENWHSVMDSQLCGCYYCQRIFSPSDISPEDYTMDLNGRTVIGDASGIPINPEILEELYEVMFNS